MFWKARRSCEVGHDIRCDQFEGLGVVPEGAVDEKPHAGTAILTDQLRCLRDGAGETPERPPGCQVSTAWRRGRLRLAPAEASDPARLYPCPCPPAVGDAIPNCIWPERMLGAARGWQTGQHTAHS